MNTLPCYTCILLRQVQNCVCELEGVTGPNSAPSLDLAPLPPQEIQPFQPQPESTLLITIGNAPRNQHLLSREPGANNDLFIQSCFPHPTQEFERQYLGYVLQQEWWIQNVAEPDGALAPLLIKFFRVHQCAICSKIFNRGDRALEHVRNHLAFRPFLCPGALGSQCPNIGCSKRFFSPEALKDHQRQKHTTCSACGMKVLKKNWKRHSRSCNRE